MTPESSLQLAWILLTLRRHHRRGQAVRTAVRQREALLSNLRLLCARVAPPHTAADAPPAAVGPAGQLVAALDTPQLRASVAAELHSLLALVRRASVQVVEAVQAWRSGLRRPVPFELNGTNYIETMADEPAELRAPHLAKLLAEAAPLAPAGTLDAGRLWAARQAIAREPEIQQRVAAALRQEAAEGFKATTLRWSPLDEAQVLAELGRPSATTYVYKVASYA